MSTLCDVINDGDKGRSVLEFEKMRFELAWRHFDFHAKQRTTMFHFFILLAPFLFGGCFILFKEREAVGSLPAIVAATGGAILAFIFFLLDLRNKQLYRVSKEALKLLEQQFLFTSYRPFVVNGSNYPGIICTEGKQHDHQNLLKHGLLMGSVYWIAICLFVGLASYFLVVRLGCIKLPFPSQITQSIKELPR